MSYPEKKTVVTLGSSVLLFLAYCVTVLSQYNQATNANDLAFWAKSILVFIGISVVVLIVIHIIFHVLLSISVAMKNKNANGKEIEKEIELQMVEDERDQLIELKALRIGYKITGIGFVAGLLALFLGSTAAVMLNIMFISGWVGTIAEGLVQFYYYRKDA